MDEQLQFSISELIPLEAPFTVRVENLIQSGLKSKAKNPISWGIFENGKMKTITMPSPLVFEQIYKAWSESEDDILLDFSNRCKSVTQIPIRRSNNSNEKKVYTRFSHKFFEYKNAKSYGALKSAAYHELEKSKEFVSQLDLKSFFSSIYIHSIQWSFFEGVHWEKKEQALNAAESHLSFQVHEIAKMLSSTQTNGLPIGPNLSRILSQYIAFLVDEVITQVMKNAGSKKVIIYRYIDDFFIRHSMEIDNDTLDEIDSRLLYLNLKLNRDKSKGMLNIAKANKWEPLNKIISEIKPAGKITGLFNRLKRYASVDTAKYNGAQGEKFRAQLQERLEKMVEKIKLDKTVLKLYKALQMNFVLKAYLLLRDRKCTSDSDVCKEIEAFSIRVWESILSMYPKFAPILNTFSPLIYIIKSSKNVEAKNVLDRIANMDLLGIESFLFPFSCSVRVIDAKWSDELLLCGYNLKFKKRAKITVTKQEIISRINNSYVYDSQMG